MLPVANDPLVVASQDLLLAMSFIRREFVCQAWAFIPTVYRPEPLHTECLDPYRLEGLFDFVSHFRVPARRLEFSGKSLVIQPKTYRCRRRRVRTVVRSAHDQVVIIGHLIVLGPIHDLDGRVDDKTPDIMCQDLPFRGIANDVLHAITPQRASEFIHQPEEEVEVPAQNGCVQGAICEDSVDRTLFGAGTGKDIRRRVQPRLTGAPGPIS